MAVERDLLGLATPVGALQLDRASNPLVPEQELVAVPVDFGPQDLGIVHPHAPKRPQEVAKEDVLQHLLAPARMGGMHRINGAGDLLRVRLSGHLSGPGRQDHRFAAVWVAEFMDTLLCTIAVRPAALTPACRGREVQSRR